MTAADVGTDPRAGIARQRVQVVDFLEVEKEEDSTQDCEDKGINETNCDEAASSFRIIVIGGFQPAIVYMSKWHLPSLQKYNNSWMFQLVDFSIFHPFFFRLSLLFLIPTSQPQHKMIIQIGCY